MNQSYNKKGFIPASADAPINHYPVAASQTFEAGDMLALSSGQVIIATAASARLLGAAAEKCDSLAENTMVGVYDDIDQTFIGTADADSSSAEAGVLYDLVGTTGAMQIDIGASTTDVFRLKGQCDSSDDTSSANAKWLVKINKHALATID